MKILYVVSSFAPAWGLGGGVRVAYEVSINMSIKGHQVQVYTTDLFSSDERIKNLYNSYSGVEVFYFKNISNYLASKHFHITPNLILQLEIILINLI
jgi:uncharacterized radical SAM superfamily protein